MAVAKDLKEFVASLNAHGVEYLIVGGFAVAYHGHPRTTGDIDLFIRSTPENADRVCATLAAFGFASLGITPADLLKPNWVVQMGIPPNRIDIITSVDGVVFEDAWHSRRTGNLDEVPATFIGREDLLKNKRASARGQDLADVEALSRLGEDAT